MPINRPLQKDKQYVIIDSLSEKEKKSLIGFRCTIVLQLSDDGLPSPYVSAEILMLGGPFAGQRVLCYGLRLRRYSAERQVCRCKAYSFPHHKGKGRCYASHTGPFCGDCGKPSAIDQGFIDPESRSPGELPAQKWGYMSTCCQAELFDDPELTIPFSGD